MLPIDRYLMKKSLEISKQIQGLKLIYLDTNYWLRLRDELPNKWEQKSEFSEIVLDLFNAGKCLFPISNITYYEILKQQDENSRRNTFEIISKLSSGISLLNDKERIKIEFAHWMATGQNKVEHAANELVWSKTPTVIAYNEFASIDYSGGTIDLQDAYFDFMAEMPLSDITPDASLRQNPFVFKDNVDDFNANKKLYEYQNKTYGQLFLSEIGGMLDEAEDLFNQVMQAKFFYDTGRVPTTEEIKNSGKLCRFTIYNLFKLNKIGTLFPFFQVCADIYSSFRWNKSRIYKDGNDTLDVMHAAAALPYCDYFFTERELATIISQRKLGELYNCKVASKQADVIQLLKKI